MECFSQSDRCLSRSPLTLFEQSVHFLATYSSIQYHTILVSGELKLRGMMGDVCFQLFTPLVLC